MRILLTLAFLGLQNAMPAQVLFQSGEAPDRVRHFDVIHYALTLGFDEQRREVHGTTRITLTTLGGQVDSVRLDAVRMDIHSVSSSAGPAVTYRSDSVSLTLFPAQPLHPGDTMTVSIDYSCRPERGLHFIQPDSSDLTRRWQIWTQGEESDNRHWFPCYDAPDDKATSEVTATVGDAYRVLSNGYLVSETADTIHGRRTFHWRQDKPHSSYLIMIAAGDYDVITDAEGSVPVSHYVPSGRTAEGLISFAGTRRILDGLTEIVGHPYPWDKYSQVVLYDFMWGGMENTSAVTLNEAYLYDRRAALDFTADPVIAHEIAHQWWGDLITCRDWTHLWLHEGFANYYEGLYKRGVDGLDEHQYEAYQWAKSIRRLDETAGRKPIVSHESFSVNLYQRGAWVLRMLARILGEERLLESLTGFLGTYQYEAVTTDDLIASLEEQTGEELSWFFDQWVYRSGYPMLDVTTSWDGDARLLRLTVAQQQPTDSLTGIFRFPLDLEITTASGIQRREFFVDEREERFLIPLDERPEMVLVDKGLHLLKSLTQQKTRDEYLYQLLHAEEGVDRLDAIEGLSVYGEESGVVGALKRSALRDPFWAARVKAVNTMADMETEGGLDLFSECLADNDSRVRSAAIEGLGSYAQPDVASLIERVAREDSSYLVLTSCIRTLAGIDSVRGFQLAADYAGTDSYRDMVRASALNALRRLKDPRAIPIALRFIEPSFETSTRLIALGILEDAGKGDLSARSAVSRLAENVNDRVRLAAVRALGTWDDETSREVLRARKEAETDPGILEALDEALGQ